jgi:hypothetical protein
MERHPFDPLSFLFGALFIGAGLVLLTGSAGSLPMQWVGPLVAIGLGVLILFAARPRRADDDGAPLADDA